MRVRKTMTQCTDAVMLHRFFDLIDTAVTGIPPQDLDPLMETVKVISILKLSR